MKKLIILTRRTRHLRVRHTRKDPLPRYERGLCLRLGENRFRVCKNTIRKGRCGGGYDQLYGICADVL